MALGFNTENKSGGDILPIIKYDAKAGDFIIVDRSQNAEGQWGKNESEMSLPVKIAMDLDNIEVGWLSFSTGIPDFVMAKIGEPMPAKPSDEHKQAFRVKIGSKDLGLREFSHSAKTVLKRMDELHTAYMTEKASNAGKMPIIEISGTDTVKIQSPNGELRFKEPVWKITGWTDRPEMFDVKAAAAPAPEPVAQTADEDPLF